jgi:hypothetical protein
VQNDPFDTEMDANGFFQIKLARNQPESVRIAPGMPDFIRFGQIQAFRQNPHHNSLKSMRNDKCEEIEHPEQTTTVFLAGGS